MKNIKIIVTIITLLILVFILNQNAFGGFEKQTREFGFD